MADDTIDNDKDLLAKAKEEMGFRHTSTCKDCTQFKCGICQIGEFKVEGASWYTCDLFESKHNYTK